MKKSYPYVSDVARDNSSLEDIFDNSSRLDSLLPSSPITQSGKHSGLLLRTLGEVGSSK